jgi:N-formylglutamate amidohydrolase
MHTPTLDQTKAARERVRRYTDPFFTRTNRELARVLKKGAHGIDMLANCSSWRAHSRHTRRHFQQQLQVCRRHTKPSRSSTDTRRNSADT